MIRASSAFTTLPAAMLATAIDAVGAGVAILTGRELRFTFVNRACGAILPGVDMAGQRLRDIFPRAADAGIESALRQVLETGRPWRIDRYSAPAGADDSLVWEGEAVRADADAAGGEASVVVVVRNVTETVRVERALAASEEAVRQARRKLRETIDNMTDITDRKRTEKDLRESNSRKDEFLAMLAHELRNPLAPIAAGAQLLEGCAGDENRVRMTGRVIARQARHMAALLDGLLDASRVTRGHIVLRRESVEIASVLAHAIEQASPLMLAREQQFHGPAELRAMWVLGDHTRLTQAVSNLLNNAAKYTPRGGAIILAASADDSRIGIVVSDNGIGIDAELLPSVFNLFAQGERAPDRAEGGLGLGLPLVKSIVAMHGGEVGANSAGPGKGSVFFIVLPRLQAPATNE